MTMSRVRMDDHGRTLVPAHLRRELDLCPDDLLVRRDQMLGAPPERPRSRAGLTKTLARLLGLANG